MAEKQRASVARRAGREEAQSWLAGPVSSFSAARTGAQWKRACTTACEKSQALNTHARAHTHIRGALADDLLHTREGLATQQHMHMHTPAHLFMHARSGARVRA